LAQIPRPERKSWKNLTVKDIRSFGEVHFKRDRLPPGRKPPLSLLKPQSPEVQGWALNCLTEENSSGIKN
jgi:hypothetical protein